MKWVERPRGLHELEQFRAAHPPAQFASSKAAWECLRSEGRNAYEATREALRRAQGGLCAYCEARPPEDRWSGAEPELDPRLFQIEHIRPKETGPEAALDPDNLLFCCDGGTVTHPRPGATRTPGTSCGAARGVADALDPRTLPSDTPLFTVSGDGVLEPHHALCRDRGLDPDELRRVINNVLQLNCPRLQQARKAAYEARFEEVEAEAEANRAAKFGDLLKPDPNGWLVPFWTVWHQVLTEHRLVT